MNLPEGVSAQDAAWLLRDKYEGVESEAYEQDLQRLAAGEPLGYVIGWVPFLGLAISLASHPLIPRAETEWWVERLIEELRARYGDKPFTFLDLCAGSGAIGCAILAALPNARVSFGELDPAHAPTIRANVGRATSHIKRADIRIGDLFEPFAGERFDCIAANPPYIPEARMLPREVAAYEPREALYAGADGLAVTRRIAEGLPSHLAQGGCARIEVDAIHASAAQELFARAGFAADIRTDQYGRPRLIVAN
ncbi:MAG TPA: HemK/PrmC family methyltransferase [Candidatus Paceibacterota bacterium]